MDCVDVGAVMLPVVGMADTLAVDMPGVNKGVVVNSVAAVEKWMDEVQIDSGYEFFARQLVAVAQD